MHPPKFTKELFQERFADFADGADSFYNDLNLESLDSSTTLVGTFHAQLRSSIATSARHAVDGTDAKGQGWVGAIVPGTKDELVQYCRGWCCSQGQSRWRRGSSFPQR
jgi:hypothetical protein